MLSWNTLQELRELIQQRRIGAGMSLLEQTRDDFANASPGMCHAGVALGCLAQWVDAGFDDEGLLLGLIAKFPLGARAALPLNDYVHLRLAEALIAMRGENLQ